MNPKSIANTVADLSFQIDVWFNRSARSAKHLMEPLLRQRLGIVGEPLFALLLSERDKLGYGNTAPPHRISNLRQNAHSDLRRDAADVRVMVRDAEGLDGFVVPRAGEEIPIGAGRDVHHQSTNCADRRFSISLHFHPRHFPASFLRTLSLTRL